MDQQRLILLLHRYHDNTLKENEREELLSVTDEETIINLAARLENETFIPYIFKEGEADIQISAILDSDIIKEENNLRIAHRVHFLRRAWFRYAAAIIIVSGIGAYLWNNLQKDKPLITQTKPVPVKKDILPGSNRAILTLSDGKNIELDSSGKLTYGADGLAKDAAGNLIYGEDRPSFPFEKGGSSDVRSRELAGGFNTMSTPKGGQYQLTLSDGTKVWLNAASTITYPTIFTEKTREVSITGEAYFEVKQNKSAPFIVKTNKEQITVLGTEFNVNAYPDETSKTTLVNGSVKVALAATLSPAGGSTPRGARGEGGLASGYTLKPGQAFTNGKIINTNITQDIAWKNGVFDFNNLTVEQAMRQLARWYDINIKYEGNIESVKFSGGLDRGLTLQQLLRGLEGIGGLHFTIQDNTVIVSRSSS